MNVVRCDCEGARAFYAGLEAQLIDVAADRLPLRLVNDRENRASAIGEEETEVLEIGHAAMKRVFDTNPDLVESLSFIMAERRQGLASQADSDPASSHSTAGILSSIKRFFGL